MKLDEAVGDYRASYGDAAYSLGFYDGMEVGLEHGNLDREQQEKTMEKLRDWLAKYRYLTFSEECVRCFHHVDNVSGMC